MGRWLKRIVRFRFFPSQPTTILLTLLLFTLFAIALTVILIHTLNPDKEPLPWRAYCSMPPPPRSPPSLSAPTVDTFDFDSSYIPPPFPPVGLDSRPPAGILLGVFTTDHAVERRMLIRSTWARHVRSRNGAGAGDDGRGTSRTIIKFILGRPRSKWERRVQLEMETYNDIVILPITENMNDGKTHAFFSWASTSAWVPPPAQNSTRYLFSYSNSTSPPPPLSLHDPRSEASARPWVRPDYIVKSDDDSFVMLAELEARLRLELSDAAGASRPYFDPDASPVVTQDPNVIPVYQDPLVYWGYLVKNRFMAGELYALSWSLVDWLSNDATVKGMTRGAEDKQVAKWMRLHPRANEVRWASERCWIYDHPRAATVYSHGFLFPSEVTRVRRNIKSLLQSILYDAAYTVSNTFSNLHAVTLPDANMASSQSFSYSTVSAFRTRYSPPLPNLTPLQSVEALVEGSAMSLVRDSVALGGADAAWRKREGRRRRYEGKRVGGTTVVHFIKRNEWFLETALALLEGDEVVEAERHREAREDEENLQEEEEEEEEVEDEVISDDEDDDTVSAALDVESIRSVDEDDRGDGQPVNTFASHSSLKHAASRRKR
ncbi:hypothetical protein SISNIDRAFT_407753 [Sistotremastrum niveocremeum HHB9708]|uniref:Glycosyltransferase family 31 protein n=1 Tax=Sistotremastrum niveocremeum HHB9708 TaxID=1314777 RepID=A0A164XIL2_9AGAM|nr:hypothetical protein SISNIDRAFT_407753 [Sistotremastrum niveocremeum HHB9708]